MNLPQFLLSFVAIIAIFLIDHRGLVLGIVISPHGVALVCSGDLKLELTCTTSGSFLKWSFFLTSERQATARIYERVLYTESTPSELIVNSITFTFSRISVLGTQPLISRLTIDPVSDDLNGTEVNCTDVHTSNSTSTRIQVFNENIMIDRQQNIDMTTLSEQFERENVTVTLELTELNTLYSYHVSAIPQLISHMFIVSTVVELKLSYNVHYNVSIKAASPCGKNNITMFTDVYYVKCANPADLQIENSIVYTGYKDPVLEGYNITIRCTSEHVQNDTIIAMCGENGKWEPDIEGIALNCSDIITATAAESVVTSIVDSNSVVLGAILGVVISGVLIVLVTSTFIVILVAKIRLRAQVDVNNNVIMSQDYEYERYAMNTDSSFNIDHHEQKSGLVYVEIAQSSYNQQPSHLTSTHLLNDDTIEYAQLNHNLPVTSTALKTHVQFEPTENNTCVNLDNILIQLRPQVTSKWHQFGEAVGIEKEVLDSCAETCSPEDCIVEMLDYWLRNSLKKPTWRDVAEALKVINLPQLANDIEMVYSTGKLPVDVDMIQVSFQKGSFDYETATESPQPLPPKMIEDKDMSESKMGAEIQASVPPLPPKPVN